MDARVECNGGKWFGTNENSLPDVTLPPSPPPSNPCHLLNPLPTPPPLLGTPLSSPPHTLKKVSITHHTLYLSFVRQCTLRPEKRSPKKCVNSRNKTAFVHIGQYSLLHEFKLVNLVFYVTSLSKMCSSWRI